MMVGCGINQRICKQLNEGIYHAVKRLRAKNKTTEVREFQ